MGRVSDMAMDQQQEGVDELLCEIDHWKGRADEAKAHLDNMLGILEGYAKVPKYVRGQIDDARAFLEAKP